MGKIVLMYWDCKYCGTKTITGDKRECPNCGHPRDNNITFYLNPQKVTYVEEEKAKKVSRNPDWVCSFCDSLNSDNDKNCKSCGASKEASEANYFENKKKREEKEASHASPSPHSQSDSTKKSESTSSYYSSYKHNSTSSSHSNSSKGMSIPGILGIIFLCLLVCGIAYFFFSQTQDITVQTLSWKYTIQIEELKTVEESGWSLPSDARLKDSQTELHHYDDVLDHYETRTRQVQKQRISGYETYVSGYRDLGNGYAEEITSRRPVYETYYETETYQEPIYRKEPVYQTKYYYEVDRWIAGRKVVTSGNDKTPYWGQTNLSSHEREGTKTEEYSVYGKSLKGKEVHFSLSFDDFKQIEVGRTYTFKVNFGTGKLIQK